MMRSLYSAVSGLKTHQTRMDVIGNNIANVNTEAFKSSRVTFSEIMYQTTASASGGNAATGIGGINAKQIGLGVKIGGISRNFEVGTFVNTGRDTDVMISGNGYFVVQGGDGKQYYTRDGVFTTDSDGNLVTQSGMKVVGASTPYSGTP